MFKLPPGAHKVTILGEPLLGPLAVGTAVRVISRGENGERCLCQLARVCKWPSDNLPPPDNYYCVELEDGRRVGMHRRDLSTDAIDLVSGLDR